MDLDGYLALSIVAPNGTNIAQGLKTIEVRSWKPQHALPLKDVVIVENQSYLIHAHDEEVGLAVALVDFTHIEIWQPDQVKAACASAWVEGYWAWHISNIRPIHPPINTHARRKLYLL